jgi:hypothetical protein
MRGFRLLPLAELGASGHAIEVHPKAMLGAGWNSNPLWLSDSGSGDAFLRASAGLEARSLVSDRLRFEAEGVADAVQYQDTPGRSYVGGEGRVRAIRADDISAIGLDAHWTRDSEPIAPLPEQVRRELWGIGARGSFESGRVRLTGQIAADWTNYLEDAPYFSRDERDARHIAGQAEGDLLGGSGSLIGVVLEGATAAYRDTSTANPYEQLTAQARWQHPLGDRMQLDLRLGGSLRQHDDDTAGLASNDDRTVAEPVGSLGLQWSWESGSWLTARLAHRLTDGTGGSVNASVLDALTMDSRLRIADRLGLRSSLWLAERTDSGQAQGLEPLSVRSFMLRTGLEHYLRDGVGVRLWIMLQDSDTSTGVHTTGSTASLELALAL